MFLRELAISTPNPHLCRHVCMSTTVYNFNEDFGVKGITYSMNSLMFVCVSCQGQF